MGGGGSKKKEDEAPKPVERWYPGKNVRRATALKDKYRKKVQSIASYVPAGGYASFDALYEADPEERVLGRGRLNRDVVTVRRRSDGVLAAAKTVTPSRCGFADMQKQYAVYAALKETAQPREAIVPVLDVCLSEADETLCVCTAVQEHGNLANYIGDDKTWSEATVKEIMKKLLRALARVHAAGFVHRQIDKKSGSGRVDDGSGIFFTTNHMMDAASFELGADVEVDLAVDEALRRVVRSSPSGEGRVRRGGGRRGRAREEALHELLDLRFLRSRLKKKSDCAGRAPGCV